MAGKSCLFALFSFVGLAFDEPLALDVVGELVGERDLDGLELRVLAELAVATSNKNNRQINNDNFLVNICFQLRKPHNKIQNQ